MSYDEVRRHEEGGRESLADDCGDSSGRRRRARRVLIAGRLGDCDKTPLSNTLDACPD